MGSLHRQLALQSPFLILAYLAPSSARTEIIIDDFDDPVQIVLPEMKDDPVSTEQVGELRASRLVFVGESQTDPIGLVDVNDTKSSHLTARIDGQFLSDPLNTPLLSVGAAYDFSGPTDLTEGEANDALLIDVTTFQGSGIPGDLSVLIRDTNDTFAANVSRFSLLSDSPYTLAIPFSAFGFRGGGGGEVDFSTVDLLEVRVRLLQGSRNPDTNWFVQIDRIRVGRSAVVPEPNSALQSILAAFVFGLLVIRQERLRKHFGKIGGNDHDDTSPLLRISLPCHCTHGACDRRHTGHGSKRRFCFGHDAGGSSLIHSQ